MSINIIKNLLKISSKLLKAIKNVNNVAKKITWVM